MSSIASALISISIWVHEEPFAASLSGVHTKNTAEEHFSWSADDTRRDSAVAKGVSTFETIELDGEFTLSIAPRARTSYLPQLPPQLFQLPPKSMSIRNYKQPTSLSASINRPLLRRSQSPSTTTTSSSFYSRSTIYSDVDLSLHPYRSSYQVEGLAPYKASASKLERWSRPEVPPIPNMFKTSNRHLLPPVRPLRPSARPGMPPAACWQYNSRNDDSRSWMTETTSYPDTSNPSICRSASISRTTHSPSDGEGGNFMRRDVHQVSQPSYERLRKSGSQQQLFASDSRAQWSGLDDREDPRSAKRTLKKRESRTLVKKRQP